MQTLKTTLLPRQTYLFPLVLPLIFFEVGIWTLTVCMLKAALSLSPLFLTRVFPGCMSLVKAPFPFRSTWLTQLPIAIKPTFVFGNSKAPWYIAIRVAQLQQINVIAFPYGAWQASSQIFQPANQIFYSSKGFTEVKFGLLSYWS